ncbi:type IV pilin protein [Xylophilus ampelinus]|nr:type IV pilin protein [Xylophilus ampelinus]
MRKGRRAQARSALVELMQQQERYMTQRNTYMVFSTAAAAAVAGATFKVYSGDSPTNPAYSLTANVCPVDSNGNQPDATVCIKLIARPNTPDPKLTEINLTSTGIKDCILNAGFTDKKICWP